MNWFVVWDVGKQCLDCCCSECWEVVFELFCCLECWEAVCELFLIASNAGEPGLDCFVALNVGKLCSNCVC